jgi:hypothetical protein
LNDFLYDRGFPAAGKSCKEKVLGHHLAAQFSGKFFATEAPDFAKASTRQAEDTESLFLFAHRDQPSLKLWHDRNDDGQKKGCTFGDNSKP